LKRRVDLKPATLQFWEWSLKAVLESWAGLEKLDAAKVTAKDCQEWAARMAKEWSATYYNNALVSLRRVFDVAMREGAMHRNPAARLPRRRPKPKVPALPTKEQFQSLIATMRAGGHHSTNDVADLIELLCYTGLRKSEAAALCWQDVDFIRGVADRSGDAETATKNWEVRRVPLIPEARKLLGRMRQKRIGEQTGEQVLRVHDARGTLEKACKLVGIPRLTHHDFRHYFCTVCLENGVDIPTVARWLGHKDGGALIGKVYGHLRDEHSLRVAQGVSFLPQPVANAVHMNQGAL
jgi:integrase